MVDKISHEAKVYLEEVFGINAKDEIPPVILKAIEDSATDTCLPMDEKSLDIEIYQANLERMKVAI